MKSVFDFFSCSVKAALNIYENQIKSKFMKLKNVEQSIRKKIKNIVQKIISFIFGKPSSIKDYFKITQWYISKRFLCKIIIVFTALLFFIIYAVIPFIEGRLWAASLVVNTDKYHQFTGKCKVYNKDGSLLYVGNLEDGVINGEGELYKDNKLVYKGSFKNNKYDGEGTLYENGDLLYKGEFLNNLYNGNGTIYFNNGNKKFNGTFENGVYKSGIEYYEDASIKFNGQFSADGYEGEGKLYKNNEDNDILYSGNFSGGKYNGKGNLYINGKLVYTGDFVDNTYSGDGKKYDNGILVYEGTFDENKYNGNGILYKDKKMIYKGEFSKGMYNGEGTLYSEKTGKLLYSGNFNNNIYDKKGTLYNEETGRMIYDGNFLNGLYDGDGILYSTSGKKIFNGKFFEGNVDYISFLNKDIDYIRECFGKEDSLEMFENSFALVYNDMKIIVEFNYTEDEDKPEFNKIKFFGDQRVNNIYKNLEINKIDGINGKLSNEDIFTAYTFEVTLNETSMSNYINEDIVEGSRLYCVKYLFEDYYIRAYSYNSTSKILYFEMGGI